MCFSASASFTAGILLSIVGIASIAHHRYITHYFLAGIPLLFGVQQISEGFVWISYDHFFSMTTIASYFYLFFAFIVWPMWVPFAILMYNDGNKYISQSTKRNPRKYILLGIIITGAVLASIVWYYVMRFGIVTEVTCSHISYIIAPLNNLQKPLEFLYGTATIIPWFLTRHHVLWILGVMITLSYAITYLFYTQYTISVWCFFAALLSIVILFVNSCDYSTHKS